MAMTRWHPFQDLKHWEPFGDIDSLRKEMDSLFERFTSGFGREINGLTFVPSVEMEETDTEIHLRLEVPGMKSENLEISVMDDAVTITGERKSEKTSESRDMLRSEFYYGEFERFVPLPSRIQRDSVTANYQDGILSLTLPKSEEQQETAIKIKVG